MRKHSTIRHAGFSLVAGTLLALPIGPLAHAAHALCADPRGPAYCTNNGQVTWSTAERVPWSTPGSDKFAPPSSRTPATAAPASAPASQPSQANISVDPSEASVGDSITVSGTGLAPGQSVWVNLAQSKLGATELKTVDGSKPQVADDGTLTSTLDLPDMPDWAVGEVSICVGGLTTKTVCSPFTFHGSATADADGAASGAGVTGTQCWSCAVVQNNADRTWGVYNSGSGYREYHGARP